MKPYYQHKWVTIYHGDCRNILPFLRGASAIVTDPPYELNFMGKSWDSKGISFQPETWQIIRNSCLAGAPLLSFAGTRTFHRIACAIEDAGWEIRDTLMWVYGSGFPKSLDISKAIDKQFGPERETAGKRTSAYGTDTATAERVSRNKGGAGLWVGKEPKEVELRSDIPATPEAKLWEGYGTALKPAYEPIILAMNPLDGTFANNALNHGVAGLNIDECRIEGEKGNGVWGMSNKTINTNRKFNASPGMTEYRSEQHPRGRFPANLIHDGSQVVMDLFPQSRGQQADVTGLEPSVPAKNVYGKYGRHSAAKRGDNGSAARFFYCAKASKAERDKGLEGMPDALRKNPMRSANGTGEKNFVGGFPDIIAKNTHPTVKPLALMEYLCKLVNYPEHNLIIDPCCGSGSTLLACIRLGIPCIGIDSDENSCEIAAKRCRQEMMELV